MAGDRYHSLDPVRFVKLSYALGTEALPASWRSALHHL